MRTSRTTWHLALVVWLALSASLLAAECDPQFGPQTDMGTVQDYDVDEVSGMAASRLNPGVYWVHNDSGSPNIIYALDGQGQLLGTYTIDGFAARDWEDIAVGPGPVEGVSYIYIGNIGDNYARYDYKYVGRIAEPIVDLNQSPANETLYGVDTITLTLPDQRRDTEIVMVDPWTKDLFIVSKRENNVNVYRAAYPQATDGTVITMELVNTLNLGWLVGGDISPSGTQIIMKHSAYAYHWCREPGQTISQALAATPDFVPYVQEQQGEAICWTANESGYYTLSEGHYEHMFYYDDLSSDIDNINPVVDIAEPLPAGTFETTEEALTVTGSASDNVGVDKVTYTLTGATVATGVAVEVHGTLIAAESDWKYLDDGSDQGTAWTAVGFDDSGWAEGSAELGYGDGDETTVVSYGADAQNKHPTTYYRSSFTLEDAEPYCDMIDLKVRRDDGVVVYLNGQEVFRNNMPAGEITYLSRATVSVQGDDEDTYQTAEVDGHLLVDGENVVAVEIHQFSASSSDTSFDLELTFSASGVNWCIPGVTLEPGSTTLKVTAEDFAGNKETEQIEINRVEEGGSGGENPGGGTSTNEANVNVSNNDYDGDGVSDLAVYEPATHCWFIRSLGPVGPEHPPIAFGEVWGTGNGLPVGGDFDASGEHDLGNYDVGTHEWFIKSLAQGGEIANGLDWGLDDVVVVPGDYNGDGAYDLAVYHKPTFTWYIRSVEDDVLITFSQEWGVPGGIPVAGDYDGDGVSDLAIFEESTGNWFIRSLGPVGPENPPITFGQNWGFPGCVPVGGDYNDDGVADLAVYEKSTGNWFIRSLGAIGPGNPPITFGQNWGVPGGKPVAGDYDGDGSCDLAVYEGSTGNWFIRSLGPTGPENPPITFAQNWGSFFMDAVNASE